MRLGRAAAPVVAFVVLTVVVAVVPSFVSAFRAQQLAYVAIYLIAIIGLNILTGYTGQISLGHGAFMAVGGYTTAILMSDHGVKDVWTIPIAALVAGIVGFLFGIPALRLSGLYLALATFAIAVSTPAVIKRFEGFTGGGSGINLFGTPELTASLTPVTILGRELTFNDWLYYLSAAVALVLYVAAWLLLRGRTGRAFRTVRDSETAAVSVGVSLPRYKTLAFSLSGFYGGVAGSLYAVVMGYIHPSSFGLLEATNHITMLVLGGMGTLLGPACGAAILVVLPELMTGLAGFRALVTGVLLLLFIVFIPQGLFGLLQQASGWRLSLVGGKLRRAPAKQ